MWGTFEIAGAIAGPIVILCLLTLAYFYFYQNKRNVHRHVGLCEDSIEAPDHPILNGVSLRHMIEMTTSGSGSGRRRFIIKLFVFIILNIFRITIASAT